MRIWIDADACPRPAKELLFKASTRLKIEVIMVADRQVGRPPGSLVRTIVVPRDMDSADKYIAENLSPGDLVITSDIPLADAVVKGGAFGLSPRGEMFDEHNVAERRSMRDFMMGLRETGMDLGGPPPYGKKDRQRFNSALDKFLTAHCK